MDSMFFILMMGICSISSVICGCPTPQELPARWHGQNVFLCARVYEHSHSSTVRSCSGQHRDIQNREETSNVGEWWNDRVSSIVVRPGCLLYIYQHDRYGGRHQTLRGGIHGHLKNIGWNDDITSWQCHCEFPNTPLTCTPRESYRTLKSCYNTDEGEMSCEYEMRYGISFGNSVTNGRTFSSTVQSSLEISFMEIFKSSLSVSTTTSFNWSQTSRRDYSTVKIQRVRCGVPAGHRVELRQVVAVCGDTEVFASQYECRSVTP